MNSSEKEVFQQAEEQRAHLWHRDNYQLPLSQMSFPDELIKEHTYKNYLYVEVSSLSQPFVHILGTDWIQFYDKPLTQDYPIGRDCAWHTYKLSKQYSELELLAATIKSGRAPKMWLASELTLVQDYLTNFKPAASTSLTEFVEVDIYEDLFSILIFLNFGTLQNANGRYLFVYPKSFRNALIACCDINYLKAWEESRRLSKNVLAPHKAAKRATQKI